jgi:hypothetical protein
MIPPAQFIEKITEVARLSNDELTMCIIAVLKAATWSDQQIQERIQAVSREPSCPKPWFYTISSHTTGIRFMCLTTLRSDDTSSGCTMTPH